MLLVLAGCSSADGGSDTLSDGGSNHFDLGIGDGDNTGLDGNVGDGVVADAPTRCGNTLTGVLRDFKQDHPDFEYRVEEDPGIVQETLGADDKPVYAGLDGNPTTTGQENFDQWFRDVPGVNQAVSFPITLTRTGGVHTYENNAFFPLDGQGFGNEGNAHNYHFTFELHTTFQYAGGETFKFVGDDDLFVFINKKLAIDLGGVHGSMTGEVNLDADAGKLGISRGQVYALDFFFAERHTVDSHFRVDTNLDFVDCGSGIK
jgi:fibro-slime domain-containing protein